MAQQIIVPASSLAFLKALKKNNNREWFNKNKDRFLEEQQSLEVFADGLLAALNQHDVIETPSGKKSLQRIYRDIRFSKDKTPYKTNWAGGFKRATKFRRGGYYFHIEPGNTFVGGGFWAPNTEDLKRIRDDIAFDGKPLRKIITAKSFIKTFGALKGEQTKLVPRGYAADQPDIDLLKYKQYLLMRSFTDEEVLARNFLKEADFTFKQLRPFFDYMSEVLSSGANGVPL
ncbi:MAG: DUF2461 domain-containing protein [Chitinophagaceae bacterium]